jgi:hypothetical protein
MESSVIMCPHMAEDITVLEQYLTYNPTGAHSMHKPYRTVSTNSGNPIVYLTVPRIREGLRSSTDSGRTQREIIEQVLSPFANEVRQLYFDHLHPCFPILDEKTFQNLWQRDNKRISSTLICDIYASALLFWKRAITLSQFPRPDLNFVWNLAVAALQDDFMGPSISTLHAALLDMIGRPIGAVTGNIVNTGRVVTLAQSLGLHRDPSSWKATAHEKHVRIRLWWGIVIHDHWSSIGHGIPPTINSDYYDVPLVTPDMLATPAMSESYRMTTSTFVQLCKLTRILGDILPHIYALRLDVEGTWRSLRKIECALDDWVVALPAYLALKDPPVIPNVNGSSNLWFSYLSLKLLMCRLAFKATIKETTHSPEARQYRLSRLRKSSCEVVDFATALNDTQLQEFWLPYTSYLLVTAATILLRCTIECGDITTKRLCIAKLIDFRDRLRRASDESEWDLADFCLERCEAPIQRFADAQQLSSQHIRTGATMMEDEQALPQIEAVQPDMMDMPMSYSGSLSEISRPVDSLEYPWESLWDVFDESRPT